MTSRERKKARWLRRRRDQLVTRQIPGREASTGTPSMFWRQEAAAIELALALFAAVADARDDLVALILTVPPGDVRVELERIHGKLAHYKLREDHAASRPPQPAEVSA